MKGSYIILIHLSKTTKLNIGRLGNCEFPAGYYIYVGSAMGSLLPRIKRHLGLTEKKIHWHVDYLLEVADPVDAWFMESATKTECHITGHLRPLYGTPVKKFGASDCVCSSHLFYIGKARKKALTGREIRIGKHRLTRWNEV